MVKQWRESGGFENDTPPNCNSLKITKETFYKNSIPTFSDFIANNWLE